LSRGRGRRLGNLLLAVAGLSALLVLASRWAGKGAGDPARGGADSGDGDLAAQGGGGAGAPDLSFYRALGPSEHRGGSATVAPPKETPAIALREPQGPLPAAPGASAGHDSFVVQVLATRDRTQARRVRERLAARGFVTSVIAGPDGARPVYRVRVGPYRDRPGAESVVRRLRAEHGLTPWILRQADR
jgi:sporulation related protein